MSPADELLFVLMKLSQMFNKNEATSGAIVYSTGSSKMMPTGESKVVINDLPAKWCSNACVPYTGQNNDASFDRKWYSL